jgi:hypothetical protein
MAARLVSLSDNATRAKQGQARGNQTNSNQHCQNISFHLKISSV